MKKQLTLKKVTLFVLSALLLVLMAISVAFSAGTRAFAADSGAGSSSEGTDHSGHDVGDLVIVKPATCVEPGVGTYYCNTCGRSFNVVIPADSTKHHTVELEDGTHKCTICGKEDASVTLVPAESEKNDDQNIYVQAVESSDEIKNLNIPATVEHEGTEKKVHLADEAFKETKLESVTIDSAVDIGENAFEGCKNLAEVKIVQNEKDEITTYVAADAFDNTPFYTKNLKKDEESGTSSLAIPVVNAEGEEVGTYLLKVELSTSGTPTPSPRAHRRDAAAEAAEITSFTVPKGTLVIASGAFSELTDLTTVTLNAELHTVCAGAFAGTKLANVIVAADVEANSFVSVDGLTDLGLNTIYYNGTFAENLKDIFGKLFELIRYYSAAEPDDAAHPYWHFSGEGETGLPVAWSRATKLFIDASACNSFMLDTPFNAEGLLVYVTYEDGTSRLADKSDYDIDSTKYNRNIIGSYAITVTYKEYTGVSATYNVIVSNAYTVTTQYGNGTPNKVEHFWALDASGKAATFTFPKEEPTFAAHKFAGWKVEGDESGKVYAAGQEYGTLSENITIVAQWETLYTVSVTGDHVTAQITGTATDDGVAGNVEYYAKGAQITFTLTVAKGYKLTAESVKFGETTLTAGEGNTYSVTVGEENVEVTVTAVQVAINKSFDQKGGNGATFADLEYSDENAKVTIKVTTNPTKDGYRFDGWDVTVDGEAATYNNGLMLDLENADVTVVFTAKWTEMLITEAYNAVLDPNPVTLAVFVKYQGFDATTIKALYLQVGEQYLPVMGDPVQGGDNIKLAFDLSSVEEGTYTLGLVYGVAHKNIYGNKTIGGSGTQKNTEKTLRYTLKDGDLVVDAPVMVEFKTDHGTTPETQYVFTGEKLEKVTEPEAEGYLFLYWYTKDAEGTETQVSGTITVNGPMTIHAKMGDKFTPTLSIEKYASAHDWVSNTSYGNDPQNDEVVEIDGTRLVAYMTSQSTQNTSDSGKYNSGDKSWNMYASNQTLLTIKVNGNAKIVSVIITYKGTNGGILTNKDQSKQYKSGDKITVNDNTAEFSLIKDPDSTAKSAAQVHITSIEVTYAIVLTDQDKVDIAYEALNEKKATLVKTVYDEAGESVDLYTTSSYGETLTWSLDPLSEADFGTLVEVENNKLTIKALPKEEDVTVTLVLEITCGETATAKKINIEITLTAPIDYGTETPLSVTEALALAEKLCKDDGQFTPQAVHVIGLAATMPENVSGHYGEFYLLDVDSPETMILVKSLSFQNNEKVYQNDKLTLHGYIDRYKGQVMFYGDGSAHDYPMLDSREAGESTITIQTNGATVSSDQIPESGKVTNGTSVTFTVEPSAGKKIYAVLINGEVDDTHSFTVEGNTTITVVEIDANAYDAVAATLAFASGNGDKKVSSYTGSWTATRDGRTWDIYGFNNNNNGWDLIKTGRKDGNAVTATITTKAAMPEAILKIVVNIDSSSKSYMSEKVKSFTLEVSTSSEFTSETTTKISKNITTGDNEFIIPSPAANCYYRITIDCDAGDDNGFVVLNSVTYMSYTPGGAEEPKEYTVTSATLEKETDTSIYFTIVVEGITLDESSTVVVLKFNTYTVADVEVMDKTTIMATIDVKQLGNNDEITLTIDGVAPTAWEGVDAEPVLVGTKNYTLVASADNKTLSITIEEQTGGGGEEAPEVTLYELTQKKDASASAYDGLHDATDNNGFKWKVRANLTTSPWHFGGRSSKLTADSPRMLATAEPIMGKVTRIELNFGTIDSNITISSVQLKVYDSQETTKTTISTITETYATKITFQAGADDWTNRYYEFTFNITIGVDTNKYFTITSLNFFGTQTEGGDTGGGSDPDPTPGGGGSEKLTFSLVKDVGQLTVGSKIVFVCGTVVSGGIPEGKDYLDSVSDATIINDQITDLGKGVAWTLQKDSTGEHWELVADDGSKLGATAVKKLSTTKGTTTWDISIEAGPNYYATVKSTSTSYGSFFYNSDSPRFTTYTSSSMAKIQLYVAAVSSDSGMEVPSATDLVANVNSEIPSSSSLWLYVLGGSALLVSVVSLSALAFVLIRKKHN